MENKFLLITLSGNDQPGITARLSEIIADFNYEIIDIGQSVIHGFLTLSALVDLSSTENSDLLKEILFEAKKLNMSVDFKVIETDFSQRKSPLKYIIAAVHSKKIPAAFISKIASQLAENGINIQRIDNKSENKLSSLDIIASSDQSDANLWPNLKKQLVQISDEFQVDIALLKDNAFRYNKRLVVFDMDSTLIQTEVIEEIAKYCGVKDQVEAITEEAMNGKIDFTQSLKKRVSLLKDQEVHVFEGIAQNLPLTPGVEEFIKTIQSLGFKTAVISGGFTYFANHLKRKLNLDYAFANELEIKNNKLTGKVIGTIVDAEQKATLVDLITQQEGISLEQVVAIGDGANDIPMLSKAGMGIAFHAKQLVRQSAPQEMSHGSMTSILSFLGVPENFKI